MWNIQEDSEPVFTVRGNETLKEAFFRCVNSKPLGPMHPTEELSDGFWLALLMVTSEFMTQDWGFPADSKPPGSILQWENQASTLLLTENDRTRTDS